MGKKFNEFLDKKLQNVEVRKWYEFLKNKKDSAEHLAGVIWQSDVMGDSEEEFKDSLKIAERITNSAWMRARDNAIIALMLDTVSAEIDDNENLPPEVKMGCAVALGQMTLMRNRLNNMIEDEEGNIVPAWTEDVEETIEQDINVVTEGEVESISADIEPGPHAVAAANASEGTREWSEVKEEAEAKMTPEEREEYDAEAAKELTDEEIAGDPDESEEESDPDDGEEDEGWIDPGGTEEEAAQSTIFDALNAAMAIDDDEVEEEDDGK